MPEKHTKIISVRVNEEIKKILVLESELEGVTLNTLIGKILTKHVSWDKFSDEIGFVMSTRPFLRSLLELVDEEDIKKLALTVCRSSWRDAIIYTTGDLTIVNFLKVLELWLHSSHIHFRRILKSDNDKFVIQHDLGEKWSLYFVTVVGAVLGEVGYKFVDLVSTPQTISFSYQKI